MNKNFSRIFFKKCNIFNYCLLIVVFLVSLEIFSIKAKNNYFDASNEESICYIFLKISMSVFFFILFIIFQNKLLLLSNVFK